jgi:hypothetical protein
MLNGNFVLASFYGGRRLPWEWEDPSILVDAWQSHKSSFGNAVMRYQAEEGRRYYCPARFQVQRLGNRILSLWGSEIENRPPPCPLFDAESARVVPG